jgi:hypothetical protein
MIKTFGKLCLDVNKYAGLRFSVGDMTSRNIHGWDSSDQMPVVNGKLTANLSVLWEGRLFTREQIGEVFKPTYEDGSPIPFAMRSGGHGRGKRVGVIRLASGDGTNYELQRCNGGEEVQEILHGGELAPEMVLQIMTARNFFEFTIFDENLYSGRVQRLRNPIS